MTFRQSQLITPSAGFCRQLLAELKSPLIATQAARRVPQTVLQIVALHLSNPFVGRRQFPHEGQIAATFGRQTVEVAQGAIDDELAGGRRARQVANAIVNLEQQ
jgi:hypothetical protein